VITSDLRAAALHFHIYCLLALKGKKNDKTDEVNIFLLKIEQEVSGSIFSAIDLYCNNKNDRCCLLKALWDLSLKCCLTFAQRVAHR